MVVPERPAATALAVRVAAGVSTVSWTRHPWLSRLCSDTARPLSCLSERSCRVAESSTLMRPARPSRLLFRSSRVPGETAPEPYSASDAVASEAAIMSRWYVRLLSSGRAEETGRYPSGSPDPWVATAKIESSARPEGRVLGSLQLRRTGLVGDTPLEETVESDSERRE
ncbi:hypothetical protein Taro_045038 [Colocasia esculenta]|uniref:Uncharacterized protein n=1 Tax=Colocasia esculenta TaxID=4460 RepID=A0A843X456_COLES|nr:hypothetical protein [Colocasia esculenta]